MKRALMFAKFATVRVDRCAEALAITQMIRTAPPMGAEAPETAKDPQNRGGTTPHREHTCAYGNFLLP